MSTYNDASLIYYPSGYKASKAYSLKPTDGSGDLDFTRASTATRVNEQGLIETAAIIGDELITNGSFATDTDWTKNGTVTISGGTANFNNAASGNNVQQVVSLPSGKKYRATYEITSITLGAFSIYVGGVLSSNQNLEVGVYTEDFISTGVDNVYVRARGTTNGSIDNVSVKEVIENNVPRIDFTGGGCGKLLLEPQRTNLVFPSQDFNAWGKTTISVTNNSTTSPDGTINASKIIPPSGTSGGSYVSKGAAGNSMYVFAKAAEKSKILIYSGVSNSNVWFDVTSGQVLTKASNAVSASIENYGNGWYKCSIIWTTISSLVRIYAVDADNSTSVVGNGTDGLFIWGAQVEDANFPTSYIPTLSTAVTRVKDNAYKIGITPIIGQTEGVMFIDFVYSGIVDTFQMFKLSDGTSNNRLQLYINTSHQLGVLSASGGATQFVLSPLATLTVGTRYKMCLAYKLNDYVVYLNGTSIYTNVSSIVPATLTEFTLNNNGSSTTFIFYNKVQSTLLFQTRLPNATLATLTTI